MNLNANFFPLTSKKVKESTPVRPHTAQITSWQEQISSLKPKGQISVLSKVKLMLTKLKPPLRLPNSRFTYAEIWGKRFSVSLPSLTTAPNPQRTLRRKKRTVWKNTQPVGFPSSGFCGEQAWPDLPHACNTHLVFGHHVSSVDQLRSDGRFVLQRLAQERVMGFTYLWKCKVKISRCEENLPSSPNNEIIHLN